MMNFPKSPSMGQQYPVPSVVGIPTYIWDGEKWKAAGGVEAGDFVKKTGDVMYGALQLPADPTIALHSATKQYVDGKAATTKTYVDTADALKLDKGGGTITGGLTVNGELVAATNYLRFVTAGGPGYIQYNGAGNYGLGGGGNIWHSANLNPQSALGYTPVNRAGDTLTGNLATPESQGITTGGSAGTLEVAGAGWNGGWAVMTFHVHGSFAFNFGANQNGNLYIGGWSHGGNYWQVWTQRDFNYRPLSSGGDTCTGTLTVNGNLPIGGNMSCGQINCGLVYSTGTKCRAGSNGGYYGNQFNFGWWGERVESWIDATFVGQLMLSSDYRIKKDVIDLPGMWDTVKALRPIKYTQREFQPPSQVEYLAQKKAEETALARKEERDVVPIDDGPLFKNSDVEQWGFIAHELQDTLTPSAATGEKDSHNTVQSPNPWTVIAALTKTLQEAMGRIETLERTAN